MARRTTIVVAIVLATSLGGTAIAGAAQSAEGCRAAKLTAIGVEVAAALDCYAAPVESGAVHPPDPMCLSIAADGFLVASERIESLGSCAPAGDAVAYQSAADDFVSGGSIDALCPAKVTAVGKRVRATLKCHAAAILKARAVDAACLTKSDAGLFADFAKAESGACTPNGDAPAVKAAADVFVAAALSVTPPPPVCPTAGPARVGVEVIRVLESAHPYGTGQVPTQEVVTIAELSEAGAMYIAPHFSKVDLDPGDFVVVRSPDGSRSWRYERPSGKSHILENFWGIAIPGDTAVIELHTVTRGRADGYVIDKFARGLTLAELGTESCAYKTESGCAPDDSLEAKCYQASEAVAYNRAKPVARLLINGTQWCTGWLFGSDNEILTNEHCIKTAGDAAQTQVEFMAEGATCTSMCAVEGWCPGTVVATSTNLIRANKDYDYALVKPVTPKSLIATYGYLQARLAGAQIDERIYVPQHPQGWGKRLAVASTHVQDQSGFAEVLLVDALSCYGLGPDVTYFADTLDASSGAPVLGYSDHAVVGLHHCAGCPSRAVSIQDVVYSLGGDLPHCALSSEPNCPSNGLTVLPECSPCVDSQQCAPPATCSGGVCKNLTAPKAIGALCCDDLQCASGSCSDNSLCECLTNDDCASGEFCDLDPFENTCTLVDGAECKTGCQFNFQCPRGMKCKGSPAGFCVIPQSKGLDGKCCRDAQCISGSCGNVFCECKHDSDCPDTAYCQINVWPFDNTCLALKDRCTFCELDRQCKPGLYCDGKPFGRCISGDEFYALDHDCCRDDQCKSGSCPADNSKCQCTNDNDCPSGKYCDKGTITIGKNKCVSAKADCALCTRDRQCGAGTVCYNLRCAKSENRGKDQKCCRDIQCKSNKCRGLSDKCK